MVLQTIKKDVLPWKLGRLLAALSFVTSVFHISVYVLQKELQNPVRNKSTGTKFTLCHGNTRMLQGKDVYFCDLMEFHKIRYFRVFTEDRLALQGNYRLYCACHTLNSVTLILRGQQGEIS